MYFTRMTALTENFVVIDLKFELLIQSRMGAKVHMAKKLTIAYNAIWANLRK